MSKNVTVNLRVNSDVKKQAGEILENMGLTLSDAFNLLLHQIRIQKALPFEVVSYSHRPNEKTLALIDRIENGTAEMAGPFKTFEEYKAWLAEDNDDDEV